MRPRPRSRRAARTRSHPSRRPRHRPAGDVDTRSETATPLVSMDIAHAAAGGGKAVNITIDDGPDPFWTPKVLNVLRETVSGPPSA